MIRACVVCGCTDERPCIGGAPSMPGAAWAQRVVADCELLAPGHACRWAAETPSGWVCSAHTIAEVERLARILDPDAAAWGQA